MQKCTFEGERSEVEHLGCISAHLSWKRADLSVRSAKVHI